MKHKQGFTLIELMVVVVIVAILAAIAYPSYTNQVRESRRAKAGACLLELAQYMERHYTTNLSYLDPSTGSPITLPMTSCRNELSNHYAFSFDGTPTATAFKLKADPTGAQASDHCGTLKIDQAGVKSPTTAGCWKK